MAIRACNRLVSLGEAHQFFEPFTAFQADVLVQWHRLSLLTTKTLLGIDNLYDSFFIEPANLRQNDLAVSVNYHKGGNAPHTKTLSDFVARTCGYR